MEIQLYRIKSDPDDDPRLVLGALEILQRSSATSTPGVHLAQPVLPAEGHTLSLTDPFWDSPWQRPVKPPPTEEISPKMGIFLVLATMAFFIIGLGVPSI